jgi:hypothetical protein
MSSIIDTPVPAAIRRTPLFTATGRDAADRVGIELSRLEAAFLKDRKRKLPVEMLFITSAGRPPNTVIGLTAYTSPEQADILAYLLATVSPSPATATQAAAA